MSDHHSQKQFMEKGDSTSGKWQGHSCLETTQRGKRGDRYIQADR